MEKRPSIAPARSDEERALVRGCRAGDRQALDRFFRAYAPRVERVLARLLGPTPDLEDLLQATFVEAMGAFVRFRGEASLATWVTRIAVHVAQHHLRRGVRRVVPLELVPPAQEPVDGARPPERLVDDHVLARRLHAALDRIKPRKRIAFLLYSVEGYDIEEVAALTGASRAATKSRIWFARRELMSLLREDPVLRELAAGLLEEPA